MLLLGSTISITIKKTNFVKWDDSLWWDRPRGEAQSNKIYLQIDDT